MARIANRPRLTLADLRRLMEKRESEIGVLAAERDQILKRLAVVDEKIYSLSGGAASGETRTRGGRARNATTLVATLSEVLSKSGKPLGVGDILEKVQASGYQSSSANFRGLINQTLIKQRKLFSNAGRGLYRLKSK